MARLLQHGPCGSVGLELLALHDAKRAQQPQHLQIARLRQLFVYHSGEARVETFIEVHNSVPERVGHVYIALLGRRVRRRKRIGFELPHVGDGVANVICLFGLRDHAQRDDSIIGIRGHRDITRRRFTFVTRWEEQVFASVAQVLACVADINQRHLPCIQQRPEERGVAHRRHLNHDRPILGVGKENDISGRGVGRGRLVLPSREFRPIHDVAVMRLGIAEETLPHHIEADDGHAPNGGIHGAAFQRAFHQFCGTELACCVLRKRVGHECDKGNCKRNVHSLHLVTPFSR